MEKGPVGIKTGMEATRRKLAVTEDAAEGLESFNKRRKARFTGK